MGVSIFFVDDERHILSALKRLFVDEPYEIATFQSPLEALEELSRNEAAVVVSDQRMPEMEGAKFLEMVRGKCPDAVRIIMTGYADLDAAIAAINTSGVYRFVHKPWDDAELKLTIKNAVDHYNLISENRRLFLLTRKQNGELHELNRNLEEKVEKRTKEIRRNEEKLDKTLQKLQKAMGGIIEALGRTLEIRDPYTAGHQRRVAELARAIGAEMGLSEEQIEGLRMAAAVHDLGKIYVPAEILNRPGRLTEAEFALIRSHPQAAYDILKDIEFPWPVAQIILQHHERLDGSGYPRGLSGDGILVEARIIAVADQVEAMASHRPYRPALGIDEALAEISAKRGIWFDTGAVDACLRLFREKRFELKWKDQEFWKGANGG